LGSLRRKIVNKLKNRYRLIIRKDDNLEEKVSVVLKPSNLILLISSGFLLFGTIIYLMLAFTPLNYIFPTRNASYSNREFFELIQKIDSLEQGMTQLQIQSQILNQVLSGEILPKDIPTDVISSPSISSNDENLSNYESDFISLTTFTSTRNFLSPLTGVMSDSFNVQRNHFGVDIVAKHKEVVKSIQQGTVIFSGWTPEGGHTIVVQHPDNFISVYKHNSVLLKKTGTFVQAGSPIALVGNTGELSSGPHLHFELWDKGLAVNPNQYINF